MEDKYQDVDKRAFAEAYAKIAVDLKTASEKAGSIDAVLSIVEAVHTLDRLKMFLAHTTTITDNTKITFGNKEVTRTKINTLVKELEEASSDPDALPSLDEFTQWVVDVVKKSKDDIDAMQECPEKEASKQYLEMFKTTVSPSENASEEEVREKRNKSVTGLLSERLNDIVGEVLCLTEPKIL